MSELSRFYGIVITIYFRDHGVPHIHAKHASSKIVIAVESGRVLATNKYKMPIPQKKLIDAWVVLHRDELLDAWDAASTGLNPRKIEPLR